MARRSPMSITKREREQAKREKRERKRAKKEAAVQGRIDAASASDPSPVVEDSEP